jgi:subfamily B ATP-binding cassette protein MsbA
MTEISYEFRTNLNSMLGFLTILNDDLVESEEERIDLAEKVYESAHKLLQGISRMEKMQKEQI